MFPLVGPPLQVAHYRFGIFEFDPATSELTKNGRAVRVRPQSLTLLGLLLAKSGSVVSRDEIQQTLWGRDTFVDFEQGVNHAIRELRVVLGDNAESPRFIQTLARRGYRFVAPVETVVQPPPSTPALVPAPALSTASPGASTLVSAPAPPRRAWMIVAFLVLASMVAALVVVAWLPRRPTNLSQPSAIAVVPFTTSDVDAALGVGLAMAITTRLGGQQRVFVRPVPAAAPSSSSNRWAGVDLRGATLVLSGDVVRKQEDVGVTARLESVATGEVVWTDRWQLRADDFHSLENVITDRVADALDLRMAAAEQQRLRRRYTDNASAYEDYLRGRAQLVRYTPTGTLAAIDAFESALRRDSSYALARAGLAMACADMCLRFATSSEVERWGQRAEAEARAALALDPNLAEAHLARAAVARKREFDWNLAVEASRRALVLNPNLDQAHYFTAAAYYHSGYMEDALIEAEKGQRLHGPDPLEPIRIRGVIALWSGDFAPARVHLEEASRLSDRAVSDTYLAQAYYYSGSVDQGLAMLRSLVKASSASTSSRAGVTLASVLANRGQYEEARSERDRVLAREYRDHHVVFGLGTVYAQLGEPIEAIRWLRRAADTGFPCLTWFERDPLLDPLRPDPRFRELLDYVRTKRSLALR